MHLANATKDDIPVMALDEESRVKWQKLGYVVSPPANKFLNAIFVSWAILLFSIALVGYFSLSSGSYCLYNAKHTNGSFAWVSFPRNG